MALFATATPKPKRKARDIPALVPVVHHRALLMRAYRAFFSTVMSSRSGFYASGLRSDTQLLTHLTHRMEPLIGAHAISSIALSQEIQRESTRLDSGNGYMPPLPFALQTPLTHHKQMATPNVPPSHSEPTTIPSPPSPQPPPKLHPPHLSSIPPPIRHHPHSRLHPSLHLPQQ